MTTHDQHHHLASYVDLKSESDTCRLARGLQGLIQDSLTSKNAHDTNVKILLSGALGSGKSTLVRYFIQNQLDTDYAVASPTFPLFILHNRLTPPVLHADMYRLESPEDVFELGLEEYFSSHTLFIEWPEKMDANFVQPDLILKFSTISEKSTRRIEFSGPLHARFAISITQHDLNAISLKNVSTECNHDVHS